LLAASVSPLADLISGVARLTAGGKSPKIVVALLICRERKSTISAPGNFKPASRSIVLLPFGIAGSLLTDAACRTRQLGVLCRHA
jgi:hypothetical protein